MSEKKRYAQVGVGGRSKMFCEAIVEKFSDSCEYVAICDNNQGRIQLRQKWCKENGLNDVVSYGAEDFEKMIAQSKCDTVIVTTRDCTHDDYICRAMELGCDVITEKPMTTDEKKCQRIIDTQKKTGRKCTVTFNYRYSPPRTQVKDLLMSGIIGEVLSVDFHWMLDTKHGADYFRRWHRNKVNSGGLMVHKATHHFDLVNWWISSIPEEVFAMGHRKFYLPETADRMGLKNRGERCLDCAESANCKFYLDMPDCEPMRELYLDCEQYDGYLRDRCVFSKDIDIEDSMNVIVKYANGVKLSYSLNAFTPWEGYMISFNGTKGRLEHMCQEKVYINSDGTVPGALKDEGTWIKIFPFFKPAYEIDIWSATGGHGGGDDPLLENIFSPTPPEDKYLRAADQRSGAYSIMTGVAANHSMSTGKAMRIDDLVQNIGIPDYTEMPPTDAPLLFD